MSEIDDLIKNYRDEVQRPWTPGLSSSERVWFVVYSPRIERQVRMRMISFRSDTEQSGHPWTEIDLTNSFGRWLASNPYRDRYFARPKLASSLLPTFEKKLPEIVRQQIFGSSASESSVVALTGTSALFGLTRVSSLIASVESSVPGRLVVFFPGTWQDNQFRLLDARDGWNYQAVPITAGNGGREA
jgi:hypothetical protein